MGAIDFKESTSFGSDVIIGLNDDGQHQALPWSAYALVERVDWTEQPGAKGVSIAIFRHLVNRASVEVSQ